MKVVVTKYICDVCKNEVGADQHKYTMTLSASDSWNENAVANESDKIQCELCQDCYNTLLQLIGIKADNGNPIKSEKHVGSRDKHLDKESIKILWAKGYTYDRIVQELGVKRTSIVYVVNRMSMEEREALIEKYRGRAIDNHRIDNKPTLEVKVDEFGSVISTKKL